MPNMNVLVEMPGQLFTKETLLLISRPEGLKDKDQPVPGDAAGSPSGPELENPMIRVCIVRPLDFSYQETFPHLNLEVYLS
ncbi:hypothetical protein NHX12_034353 [Muraenolepis orangiensis]|uniref:Uncharacterized protein n=1 Tax=Muraenolepis orangiensis TaxID=630683 RepID=A0A9Q0D321_9TELE|nr:hypothetical protein NHX12_034353 [Muraenolepis orangiensis]